MKIHDAQIVKVQIIEGQLWVIVDEAAVLQVCGFDKVLYADDRLPKNQPTG